MAIITMFRLSYGANRSMDAAALMDSMPGGMRLQASSGESYDLHYLSCQKHAEPHSRSGTFHGGVNRLPHFLCFEHRSRGISALVSD
ncbi:MAG: hypothetical protein ACM37Z_07890, partial [Deltaproteobacteria bacterium]